MILIPRQLATWALLALAIPGAAYAQTQTPITVQVINDSGLADSAINLLVVGQDVGNAAANTYNPFSVSGVAATPVGLVTNTTSLASTGNGTYYAANAPLLVTASQSSVLMSFSPATLAVAGGSSTLTITLPDSGATPANTLSQPFIVTMPSGVSITQGSTAGTCPASLVVATTTTQLSIGVGQSVPSGGCTIVVPVTAGTLGTFAVSSSYLQTQGGSAPPAAAPLNVVAVTSGYVTSSFVPSTIAVGAGNNATLTITIPNNGSATALTAPFTTAMPTAVQVVSASSTTTTCTTQGMTTTATLVTLPMGTGIPAGGCSISLTVTSIATASALSQMANTGTTATSPYTGNTLPVYSFTMATASSGSLYVSYNQPITYPTAPSVRTGIRFQPLEFSYSNGIASNGDLTSIDFYGIPLELQTFASTDTNLKYLLDRVTYYTSTRKLLREFAAVNPNLAYAFIATDGTTFTPAYDGSGNITNFANFARIAGPNQVTAGGTPPLINYPAAAPANWTGTWPPASGSPWPYGSFADYLDSLVSAGYTFKEADDVNISAYNFSYTGSIAGSRSTGYTITLTGTTGNPLPPSPLPTSGTITLTLPAEGTTGGDYNFAIYGVPQNCNTIQVSGFTCSEPTAYIPPQNGNPAVPASPGNVTTLTNSVYGWIQADVISALNFGYMNGKADAANGGGQSGVWYGIPPVQYPFGQARPTHANNFKDDGYYNAWAALMYNHSDAYGFAFSDRSGRPSPDIAFPIGGTLRIWILPDQRLDTPLVTETASDTSTITLQWPAIDNATGYTVTWSPPYETASIEVPPPNPQPTPVIATLTGLQPGTPYTITVTANGLGSTGGAVRSFEVPVYARTHGTAPTLPAGDAEFQLGFNWAAPAYMVASATPPTLLIAGQSATYPTTGSTFTIPLTTPIGVGPPPASSGLTILPTGTSPVLYTTASITPGSAIAGGISTATMTVLLGNTSATAITMPAGFTITLPPGVEATQMQSTTCTGSVVNAATNTTPSTIVMGGASIPNPGCTMVVTLTATSPGTTIIDIPVMADATGDTSVASSAPLVVPGGAGLVTQSLTIPSISSGGPTQLTVTLGNPGTVATTLVEPFIMNMPSGVTIATGSLNNGSCGQANAVHLSGTVVSLPKGSTISPGGCTLVLSLTSHTAGSTTITSGALLTSYPTQSFPLELSYNGSTIWSANFYLTMMGTPTQFSVGPCQPGDNCAGSGLQNLVPFDTLKAPNFLERQGVGLTVQGGVAASGPPFGSTVNFIPSIGVPFTPVANKKTARVRLPN